ncbi:MAG: hypothetical protein ABIN94_01060 [Ferruginibacter sp.]
MKKVLRTHLLAISIGLIASVGVHAQDSSSIGQDLKDAASKTGHAVKKSAKKVGNKSAELASKGKASVVDKIYDGKQGPNGEKIYINNKSQYYWIDKKGHRHYITEAELTDKES